MVRQTALVVDDEGDIRSTLCRLLTHHGYQALSAKTASEATRQLRQARIDLLLLDVVLSPGTGGITLCRALRREPSTSRIPIILMSGQLPQDVLELAKEQLKVPVYPKQALMSGLSEIIRAATAYPPYRLFINRQLETASIDGTPLPNLTHKCFRLLCALSERRGAVPRSELLQMISPGSDNVSLVDVTVYRLRHRLRLQKHLRIDATGSGYQLILS